MAKVKFTGDRTGLTEISVAPYGLIKRGDVVEVSDEEADRWTTQHPTAEWGTVDDVESRWTKEQLEVIARDHRLDPTPFKTKKELAKAVFEVDPSAAGQVHKADFERSTGTPDVVAFGDKEAPPPEPLAPEPAGESTDDQVTEG